MKEHLLLGTAGHIDHGKTTLIRALTGVDCDRLPDEKRRQITIDLGFAALELDDFLMGVVDVPGHERFIKNMLAGATGIDVALLVVAVDDAVKPQTREHLEILEHLNVPAGVIALTKCDLATDDGIDDDWIDLVEAEVQELTAGGILANASIVRVSAVCQDASQNGLTELRTALAAAAQRAAKSRRARREQPFRMSIDRTFSLAGHGTIVTGSVASGKVRVGDSLELQPSGTSVRVRGLQNHDAAAETLEAGQRAAINLAGVRYDEVQRGDALAPPGVLRPSRTVTVQLTLSSDAPRPLRSRTRVRFHVGAAEVQAVTSLVCSDSLAPGHTAFAQFFLATPIAACWGQPFVIRSVSPMELLGGGRVLDPWASRIRRPHDDDIRMLDALSQVELEKRISAAAYYRGAEEWSADDLFVLAGAGQPEDELKSLVNSGNLISLLLPTGGARLLHREVLSALTQKIQRLLAREHEQTPLQATVEMSRLGRYFSDVSPPLLDAILAHVAKAGQVVRGAGDVALSNWTPRLTEKQQNLSADLIARYRTADLHPPALAQLAEELNCRPEELPPLVALAVTTQQLVKLTPEVYLQADVLTAAQTRVVTALAEQEHLTVSEIRELLGTTRKVAVPLCEYFDSIGLTRRDGDLRRLAGAPTEAAVNP